MMEYIILTILILLLLVALFLYFQLQKPKDNESTALLFEMNKQLRDDIEKMRKSVESASGATVSYTHLTLPTILLV